MEDISMAKIIVDDLQTTGSVDLDQAEQLNIQGSGDRIVIVGRHVTIYHDAVSGPTEYYYLSSNGNVIRDAGHIIDGRIVSDFHH
jgi:hypothetical protein